MYVYIHTHTHEPHATKHTHDPHAAHQHTEPSQIYYICICTYVWLMIDSIRHGSSSCSSSGGYYSTA